VGHRGEISPRHTETGRPFTTGIVAGQVTEPGNGSLMSYAETPTMTRVGRGRWESTPGWYARINTRLAPATSHQPTSTRRSSPAPRSAGGAGSNDTKIDTQPRGEALGRSRAGLTTKIHLAADTRCRPLSRITTAGHRHDCLAFEAVMAGIRIRRQGPGRARTRPGQVLGDKAYSNRAILPPATTPDQDDYPRTSQPTNPPSATRPPRRTATTIRRRNLQTTQRRRTRHQQAQGLPRSGKPIR